MVLRTIISCLLLSAPLSARAADDSVYLFSSFRDPKNDALHLAYSEDAYEWKAVDGKFLKPQVGQEKLIRDPSVCRTPDGTFHMVWTTGWAEKGLGYASSKDLINWSPQKFVPVMAHEPTTMNVWAPEIRFDEKSGEFLVYWASTIPGRYPGDDLHPKKRNHRMYYATTKDFETWSPTKILFDPGHSVIDAILMDMPGGGFAMVFKDERRPMLRLRSAFSPQLLGPYEGITEPFTAFKTEGPTALRIDDKWIVYYEDYETKRYQAAQTKDFKAWTDVTARVSFPPGHKHGTAFRAPRDVLEGLKRHAAQQAKSSEGKP